MKIACVKIEANKYEIHLQEKLIIIKTWQRCI